MFRLRVEKTDMNFEEFEETLKELGFRGAVEFNRWEEGYQHPWDEDLTKEELKEKDDLVKQKLGPYTMVYSERTGTDADVYRIVYHLEQHNLYVGYDGYYDSHEGTDFSYAKWFEAEPEQVTVYNPIRKNER